MTRTEAEAYLAANAYSYARKLKPDFSGVEQPKQIGAIGYEYMYDVKFVLGDKSVCVQVSLLADTQEPDSIAQWKNGEPTNTLKSSVTSVEAQLKTWIKNNVTGYKGLLPITKSQLAEYPRWVVAPCLVESAGNVSVKTYMIYQADGQNPVKYPYVDA